MALHLIYGPVFSGKTTELIRHAKRFSAIGWKICCITPEDSLWSESSHAQISWSDTRWTPKLEDICDKICLSEHKVLLLDDCHFWEMTDLLRATLQKWLHCGKIIYAAGLDMNAEGIPYSNFLQWLPLCDNVQKLTALTRKAPYQLQDAGQSQVSHSLEKSKMREETLQWKDQCMPLRESKHGTSANYTPLSYQGTGELHLIVGPMFAGKTTELLRQATRHWHAGTNILFINHSWNERYGTVDICSHDGARASPLLEESGEQTVQFVRGMTLEEAFSKVEMGNWGNIEAIFIEEGQFFSDLLIWVPKYLSEGKRVYICGLDGDANQHPFGQLCELIPMAKSIMKERALCQQCGDGTEAPFTKRLIQSDAQVEIGTNDIYRAVCRKHLSS